MWVEMDQLPAAKDVAALADGTEDEVVLEGQVDSKPHAPDTPPSETLMFDFDFSQLPTPCRTPALSGKNDQGAYSPGLDAVANILALDNLHEEENVLPTSIDRVQQRVHKRPRHEAHSSAIASTGDHVTREEWIRCGGSATDCDAKSNQQCNFMLQSSCKVKTGYVGVYEDKMRENQRHYKFGLPGRQGKKKTSYFYGKNHSVHKTPWTQAREAAIYRMIMIYNRDGVY